jgi:hypothetical protein
MIISRTLKKLEVKMRIANLQNVHNLKLVYIFREIANKSRYIHQFEKIRLDQVNYKMVDMYKNCYVILF